MKRYAILFNFLPVLLTFVLLTPFQLTPLPPQNTLVAAEGDSQGAGVRVTPGRGGYTERGIICINGDGDFTPENGVRGGNGTVEDPYII